ncbi:hypothetical protein MMC14_003088 [Varicellaria rhodocarpa]|nr:hypothetical protein [Varicellaria rhodocarpa]
MVDIAANRMHRIGTLYKQDTNKQINTLTSTIKQVQQNVQQVQQTVQQLQGFTMARFKTLATKLAALEQDFKTQLSPRDMAMQSTISG